MIFYIDDNGDNLAGWLLPDNPATVPTVVVHLDEGRRRTALPAEFERADLKASGLHATGRCGVLVRNHEIANFGPAMALEMYEADSNILMYRRSGAPFAPVQLYHLETETFPVYPLARLLTPHVRMIYTNIELIGDQSRSYLVHSPFDSVLISGSALYRSMQAFLPPSYVKCILFSEPLREVASRLMLAKALVSVQEEGGTWRTLGMDDLIEVVRDVDLTDPKPLSRALNKMSDETFYALANPTTRKLVARLPTEKLGGQHMGSALDTLADFQVIGFDDALDDYRRSLAETLDLDVFGPLHDEEPPGLSAVMAALQLCAISNELVDLDRALRDTAKSALTAGQAAAAAAAAEAESERTAPISDAPAP